MKIIHAWDLLHDWIETRPDSDTLTFGDLRKQLHEFQVIEHQNAVAFWDSVHDAWEDASPEDKEAYLQESDECVDNLKQQGVVTVDEDLNVSLVSSRQRYGRGSTLDSLRKVSRHGV